MAQGPRNGKQGGPTKSWEYAMSATTPARCGIIMGGAGGMGTAASCHRATLEPRGPLRTPFEQGCDWDASHQHTEPAIPRCPARTGQTPA